MITKLIKSLVVVAMLMLHACTEVNETPDPTLGMTKVAEGTITTAKAKGEVWAGEALFAGYNPIYIRVRSTDDNHIIDDAEVSLSPLMYMMGGMNHSCPLENPSDTKANNGLFAGGLFLVMSTSDMGYWKLTVSVNNLEKNIEGTVELDITVAAPAVAQMRSFTTTSGSKYFIGHYFPKDMKVGINDWMVTAYKRESGMSWPQATNLTFELTPEMPSMDHGSPNNVNPTHMAGAFYKGQVNFTMTGEWRLNLKIYEGEAMLYETYFDVNVQ